MPGRTKSVTVAETVRSQKAVLKRLHGPQGPSAQPPANQKCADQGATPPQAHPAACTPNTPESEMASARAAASTSCMS
eukprot:74697-Alexandrium_andersonii.AAC.1